MKKFLCYDTNDAASGKINVDSRGMLKPNSTVPSTNGAAYQYLVTDGEGNVKWEDRLAYDDSKLVVIDAGHGAQYVKVSDEVPSWASIDVPMKVWMSNGTNVTVTSEQYTDLGNGSFRITEIVYVITTDNFETNGIVFPKKGVYFASLNNLHVTGIASANSNTPEITWDGNVGVIKKLDKKFLPDDRFVVTFTMSKDGNIASDKTFAEISTAIESGLYVYGLLIAGAATFDAIPATRVYALQMNQYVLGQGVVFIGLSALPSTLTVSSLSMDADNNISINELTLLSGK